MKLELPLLDVFGRGGALKSVLVRRLPAHPRLPDARSTSTCRAGSTWTRFVSETIALGRRRGGVRPRCTAARCCARWWCSDDRRRIEHVVTSGTFALDGGTWDVDNNVWLVGDDSEVLVIDAAHDADADRRRRSATGGSSAIVCTHAPQRPHQRRARARRRRPARRSCCTRPTGCCGTHDVPRPRARRRAGRRRSVLKVAGIELHVLHTPGHAPGAVCLYAPELGRRLHRRHPVPGRPGRDRPVLHRLRPRSSSRSATGCSPCPPDTVVHTGHGDDTTIGARGAAPGGVGDPGPLTRRQRTRIRRRAMGTRRTNALSAEFPGEPGEMDGWPLRTT